MTTTALTPTAAPARRVVYPTRDGKPMAETDKHREIAYYIISALKTYYADRSDVYVSGNNFVFWEEGNPKARISPDAYVVFGVSPDLRDSFMAWRNGGWLPSVVFEFTSRKTQREDTDTKLPLYEQTLRTPEYFLFDPTGDYLRPRLQGYRLENDRYVRLELVNARLQSQQLGLDLVQQGEDLRLFDPVRGDFLPTSLEQARRVESAEAEIARLRAELAALQERK
jgi:Uma2 family endonuclease